MLICFSMLDFPLSLRALCTCQYVWLVKIGQFSGGNRSESKWPPSRRLECRECRCLHQLISGQLSACGPEREVGMGWPPSFLWLLPLRGLVPRSPEQWTETGPRGGRVTTKQATWEVALISRDDWLRNWRHSLAGNPTQISLKKVHLGVIVIAVPCNVFHSTYILPVLLVKHREHILPGQVVTFTFASPQEKKTQSHPACRPSTMRRKIAPSLFSACSLARQRDSSLTKL